MEEREPASIAAGISNAMLGEMSLNASWVCVCGANVNVMIDELL